MEFYQPWIRTETGAFKKRMIGCERYVFLSCFTLQGRATQLQLLSSIVAQDATMCERAHVPPCLVIAPGRALRVIDALPGRADPCLV